MKFEPVRKRIIIICNFFALLILMLITQSTRLEQLFGNWAFQLVIIVGLCMLLPFGLMLAKYLSGKISLVPEQSRNKLAFTLFFMMLITGYKYVQYTTHVFSMIIYQDVRESISKKVKKAMWEGTTADELTTEEYRYIKRYLCSSLPDVPKSADSISYNQSIAFTDYSISTSYVVPIDVEIDTFTVRGSNYYHGRRFEIKNGLKYVWYSEHKY
jgi:hypothetical protein